MLSDKKIVTIGGGTGLSTMLRGLRKYTHNITAVVTVADNGGSSGILRDDLNMPAPGDIRKCIAALAKTNPIIEELINYRFSDGCLKGHPFGNLYLAALCGISDSFEEAVMKMNRLFGVEGQILPVTNDNVHLKAHLENGEIINGESNIGHGFSSRISKVEILPPDAEPVRNVLDAIADADMIILGPGSLYTSVIPNLLVREISPAIAASSAKKVYVANIMTQPDETLNHTLSDHVEAIERHAGFHLIDTIVANTRQIPHSLLEKYALENSVPVKLDIEKFLGSERTIILRNLCDFGNSYIRHDSQKLAQTLMTIF